MRPTGALRARRVACLALAAGLLIGTGRPVQAQSPVPALGLGYPPPSVDGRAAGLGGAALGIEGGILASRNPADLTLFPAATVGLTLAPEAVDVETPTGSSSTGRSRLSVLQGVVPLGEWALGLGFSQELDQDWTTFSQDTLVSALGRFPFDERRESDGGVSSVNFSAARSLGVFAVGGGFDVLTGNLRQSFRRQFDADLDNPLNTIGFAEAEASWSYSAWRLRGGVTARWAAPRIVVSAVASWTSDLKAKRDTVSAAKPTRTWTMPAGIEVGGSARVSREWLVAAAVGWKGWSETDVSSFGFRSTDTWWYGGGVEYAGLRLLGMPTPLRVGYRHADLPFRPQGRKVLGESAVTLGIGGSVARGQASFDVGVELGRRGDLKRSGARETFQRVSVSIAIRPR